jgi:hypothetical protein
VAVNIGHEQLDRVGADVDNGSPDVRHATIRPTTAAHPKLKN